MILEFDDSFKESINYLISGMLPHERYDSTLLPDILDGLIRYVKVDEMPLEYRILTNIIVDIKKAVMSISKQGKIKVSRDLVEATLSSTLEDFILQFGHQFKSWFEYRGLDTNLNINTSFEQSVRTVYEEVMNLYDDCYSKEIPSEDSIGFLVGFRNEFLRSAATSATRTQMEILTSSVFHNRKYYKGPIGWRDYMEEVMLEVRNRTDDSKYSKDVVLNSEDEGVRLLAMARHAFVPLANYGIPTLDKFIPMVTNRFSVLVAREGVGKTLYSTYLVNNLIAEGKKVLYMTGETPEEVFYSQVLSNYIYKTTDDHISVDMITHPEKYPEDIGIKVTIASMKLASSGLLVIKANPYCYDTVFEELVSDYEMYKFDAVFIDHSLALEQGKMYRDNKSRVDNLAVSLRKFKRAYPVQVFALSHPSSKAMDELARTGNIINFSPTRESSALSQEADDVFIMVSNEALEKQHIRAITCSKRRGASKAEIGTNYLKIMFTCGEFIYDPKIQNQGENSIEAAAVIDTLESVYNEDIEDDDFIV